MSDEIKLGRIGIVPKGEYSADVVYDKLDLVTHSGSAYLFKIDNNETAGIEPTNDGYWQKIVSDGEKGDDGLSADLSDADKALLEEAKTAALEATASAEQAEEFKEEAENAAIAAKLAQTDSEKAVVSAQNAEANTTALVANATAYAEAARTSAEESRTAASEAEASAVKAEEAVKDLPDSSTIDAMNAAIAANSAAATEIKSIIMSEGESLDTTAKTLISAINEINSKESTSTGSDNSSVVVTLTTETSMLDSAKGSLEDQNVEIELGFEAAETVREEVYSNTIDVFKYTNTTEQGDIKLSKELSMDFVKDLIANGGVIEGINKVDTSKQSCFTLLFEDSMENKTYTLEFSTNEEGYLVVSNGVVEVEPETEGEGDANPEAEVISNTQIDSVTFDGTSVGTVKVGEYFRWKLVFSPLEETKLVLNGVVTDLSIVSVTDEENVVDKDLLVLTVNRIENENSSNIVYLNTLGITTLNQSSDVELTSKDYSTYAKIVVVTTDLPLPVSVNVVDGVLSSVTNSLQIVAFNEDNYIHIKDGEQTVSRLVLPNFNFVVERLHDGLLHPVSITTVSDIVEITDDTVPTTSAVSRAINGGVILKETLINKNEGNIYLVEENGMLKLKKGFYFADFYSYKVEEDVFINPSENMDEGELEAGKDYYVHLVYNGITTSVKVVVSANSIMPTGYNANRSMLIGGFHTLCVDAGTLDMNAGMYEAHPLEDKLATSILPQSVWSKLHRPRFASPAGMVYEPYTDVWADIYFQSGTSYNTASVYGAVHTVNRTYANHYEDFRAVGKRMLTEIEFVYASIGSNQQTSIVGAKDHSVVGGHKDTAGRRMISSIGCEEMCGYLWQDLLDGSYGGTVGPVSAGAGMGSEWNMNRIRAGGVWNHSSGCGSLARLGYYGRSALSAGCGGRGGAVVLRAAR